MSNVFRVKCAACGHVTNASPNTCCPKCRQPLQFAPDGLLTFYRKDSPYGISGGFGIYIDGQPMGYIGNGELLRIPLTYGTHTLHVAVGMSRKCNDLVMNITPENRYVYAKVWIKSGFLANSFVIETASPDEMPELMEYIDLHSHTVHSDGRHTVEYVLNEAEKTGLSLFSISDHNNVDAYGKINEHRHLFSGKILPAVELSTMYQGEGIEVLGYGIDVDVMAEFIKNNYTSLHDKQIAEAKLLARALPEKGLKMSSEFLKMMLWHPEQAEGLHDLGPRPLFLYELRRFPENARFFESEEDFYNMTRHCWLRNYLLNPKSALYVDQSSLFPTLEKVVEVIHLAGGLAFLAHAYVYSPNIAASLDDITQNYGFDGLECHYGTFTKEQKRVLSDYCDAHGLYKSGGSDFHGYGMRPENHMGRSCGEPIELSLVEPWLSKVKTI